MSDHRILGLDGIRAIAVVMVFVSHSNNIAHSLMFGTIGVWAFFVLSGFLIIRILHEQRLDIETARSSFRAALFSFFKRRTVRIFPIYYLVLGLAAFLTLAGPVRDYTGGPWPFYWTYLTNIYIQMTEALPGSFSHLWSLAIEEQFYLLAAPAFLLTPSRFSLPLCGTLIAVGLVRGASLRASSDIMLYSDSIFNFYMMGLGGAAGLLATHANRQLVSWAAIICASTLLCAMTREFWISQTVRYTVLFFPLTIAIFYIFIVQNQSAAAVRFLDIAPLRGLGRISYGFYLYHNFPKIGWLASATGVTLDPPNKIRVIIEFALTVALATASWFVIERPLLSRLKNNPNRSVVPRDPAPLMRSP